MKSMKTSQVPAVARTAAPTRTLKVMLLMIMMASKIVRRVRLEQLFQAQGLTVLDALRGSTQS
jgi:hypothetical protein